MEHGTGTIRARGTGFDGFGDMCANNKRGKDIREQ